jgi:hypothetical protein
VRYVVWKQRNDKRYYYHTFREGRRFRNIYLGTGAKAEQVVAELARCREEQEAKRRAARHYRTYLQDEFERAERSQEQTILMGRGMLLVAGFYQHDGGEWRPRNVRQQH